LGFIGVPFPVWQAAQRVNVVEPFGELLSVVISATACSINESERQSGKRRMPAPSRDKANDVELANPTLIQAR
jgi:hypothetical protein